MTSDTPQTDQAQREGYWIQLLFLSRRLERERAAAQAEIAALRDCKSAGRCKDCKHWKPPTVTIKDEDGNPGYCTHPKICVEGDCPADSCEATDPFVSLQTGPSFGCIHFEHAD